MINNSCGNRIRFRTLAERIEAIEESDSLDEAIMKQGYKIVFGKVVKAADTGEKSADLLQQASTTRRVAEFKADYKKEMTPAAKKRRQIERDHAFKALKMKQ